MAGLNQLNKLYEDVLEKNVRNKQSLYRFERFRMSYMYSALEDIENNVSNGVKYNIFVIKEPKYRIIMSLSIKDKLVNHYVAKNYLEKLEVYLIDNNVATRKGKGTDDAITKIKSYIEENKKYDEFYVLKLDISKYFYSIDHEILKSLLIDKLTEKEYITICNIIDSTNEPYINETIKYIKEKYKIEELNDIPYYQHGKGLPIGNMTSQFLSIFYLYKLDHFIVHNLHIKDYVRYMDDFCLIHHDKKVLQNALKVIEKKLDEEYKLKLNIKKTKIVPISKGFVFLGYNFKVINKKTIIRIYSGSVKKVKQNIRKKIHLYKKGKVSFDSIFSTYMTYSNSYKHANNKKIKKYMEKIFYGKK